MIRVSYYAYEQIKYRTRSKQIDIIQQVIATQHQHK